MKSKPVKSKPPPPAIFTIDGAMIPVAELEHIAPHLRAFAVATESLKRDPNNARAHADEDLASTANSLKQFGQQHLIHFDPATRIVKVGNGRHEAAAAVLGWKWIAAIPSNLSPDQLRAFALADNRTAEKSTWDHDALQRELDALGELNIDMTGVGFDAGDLAELDESLAELETAGTVPLKRKGRGQGAGVSGQGSGVADQEGGASADQFKIVISCDSEAHQANLLERFNGERLKVRALTA